MPSSAICSAISRIVGGARAVVVDARAFGDRVEVGADDDRAVRRGRRGVGDDVRRASDGLGVLVDLQLTPGRCSIRSFSSSPTAKLVAITGRSSCRAAERAAETHAVVDRGVLPSLKMTTPAAPAAVGVRDLLPERAGAALDQRDPAGDEAGEVRRLAAAASTCRRVATGGRRRRWPRSARSHRRAGELLTRSPR